MIQIPNIWGQIFAFKGSTQAPLPQDGKYIVVWGNSSWANQYDTKEELIKDWKDCLCRAWTQDISLYYNGELIRSVSNFNLKVTGQYSIDEFSQTTVLRCHYKKYHVHKSV
jgi:hypothetical protein